MLIKRIVRKGEFLFSELPLTGPWPLVAASGFGGSSQCASMCCYCSSSASIDSPIMAGMLDLKIAHEKVRRTKLRSRAFR
jgi:hypothetical protein